MGIKLAFMVNWTTFGVGVGWLSYEKQFGVQLGFFTLFIGRS